MNNLALELALTGPDFQQGIEEIFAEWRTALTERIAQTRGGAQLNGKERAAAANFVICVYSGAMNLAKATQSADPLADAEEMLSDWLKDHRFTDGTARRLSRSRTPMKSSQS